MNSVRLCSISAFIVASSGTPLRRPMTSLDVLQVRIEAADQAAEHRIGIAQVHHQGGDDGGGAAHGCLGRLGADAAAAHDAVVGLPVLAEARIAHRG